MDNSNTNNYIDGQLLKDCFIDEAYYTGRTIRNKIDSLLNGKSIIEVAEAVFEPPIMPEDTVYVVIYVDKEIINGEVQGGYWDVVNASVKQITYNNFGQWIVTYDTGIFSSTSDFGEVVFRIYDEAREVADKYNRTL